VSQGFDEIISTVVDTIEIIKVMVSAITSQKGAVPWKGHGRGCEPYITCACLLSRLLNSSFVTKY